MGKRRIAAAAALAACLASGAARADELDFIEVDKAAHFSVSYGLSFTGQVIMRRHRVPRWQAAAIAAAATLALGTFKELVLDDPYSWGDQAANALGVGISVGVVFAFDL